jgi:hypothetical protein
MEKMSIMTLRAMAVGIPLACGALVMHIMNTSISFEQEAQILLYGARLSILIDRWP